MSVYISGAGSNTYLYLTNTLEIHYKIYVIINLIDRTLYTVMIYKGKKS